MDIIETIAAGYLMLVFTLSAVTKDGRVKEIGGDN